jgi:hypothetical protein
VTIAEAAAASLVEQVGFENQCSIFAVRNLRQFSD